MSRNAAAAIWAVVPVKSFATGKRRLAGRLDANLRRALVRAMLEDVLAALARAEGLAGLAVASADAEVAALARARGLRLLSGEGDGGLNAAATAAAATLAGEGAAGMLVLPADLPAVTGAEIETLIAGHGRAPAISLVPAHDGDGTNALLASPPDLLDFTFGPASFGAHRAASLACGVVPAVRALPGIAHDLDTPADLDRLAGRPVGRHTRAVLDAARAMPIGSGTLHEL